MNRLLRVEVRRYRARRVTLWVLVGVLAVAGLSTAANWVAARPPTPTQVADAQRYFEQEKEAWDENGEQQVADCKEAEADDPNPDADYGCEQMEPRLVNYLPTPKEFFPDPDSTVLYGFVASPTDTPDADLASDINQSVLRTYSGISSIGQMATPLLFAALLVAVSFMTAELSTGAIGLWLTFEPRRSRVYWSKAAAVSLGSVAILLVGLVLVAGGILAAHLVYGTVGTAPDGIALELVGFVGRVAAAGVVVALVGLALGTLFKHAAAGIGVAAAWLGAETMFRWNLGEAQRWLISTNLSAWLRWGEVFQTSRCAPRDDDGMMTCEQVTHVITPLQGGLVLLGLAAVLSALAWLVFRRRDVA